jgi:hypothetical protein
MTHAESRHTPGDRAWVLPGTIRRALLLGPPLLLAAGKEGSTVIARVRV